MTFGVLSMKRSDLQLNAAERDTDNNCGLSSYMQLYMIVKTVEMHFNRQSNC